MNILAPWSLSSYITLGGFDPLYRALLSHREPGLRVFAPRTPGLDELQKLVDFDFFGTRPFSLAPPRWAVGMGGLFEEFSEAHGARDLWLQAHLPGDIELHHTAPVTSGDRPFVLHCESFLAVFFPFFQKETDFNPARVERIRTFYRNLFENENCLAVISHLPQTLEQFSLFFLSHVIDKKLVGVPIGLDSSQIAKNSKKSSDKISFIFLSPLDADGESFLRLGGFCSLKLVLQLLREGRHVTFWLLASRPSDGELAAHGISPEELRQYEAIEIVWIEHPLTPEMQTALIAKSHFALFPGVKLCSASILSALGNGTIPIVTDTIGTDLYVDDDVNGVIIPGIRAECWTKDETLRLTRERHDRFFEVENAVSASLIEKVREVLAAPAKIDEMADAGRQTISRRFSSARFASALIQEITERHHRSTDSQDGEQAPRLAENERWIEDLSFAHFAGPSRPIERLRLERGAIIQLNREFFFLPDEIANVKNDFWSPVPWWGLQRYRLSFPKKVSAIRAASLAECLELVRDDLQSYSISLAQRVRLALLPYRALFLVARRAYRVARWLKVVR